MKSESVIECNGRVEILEDRGIVRVILSHDNVLNSLLVLIPSVKHAEAIATLNSRHGKARVEKTLLQNAYGARLQNETHYWSDQRSNTLTVSKYGSDVTTTSIHYSTKAFEIGQKPKIKPQL
jgi:hypothetical protein